MVFSEQEVKMDLVFSGEEVGMEWIDLTILALTLVSPSHLFSRHVKVTVLTGKTVRVSFQERRGQDCSAWISSWTFAKKEGHLSEPHSHFRTHRSIVTD